MALNAEYSTGPSSYAGAATQGYYAQQQGSGSSHLLNGSQLAPGATLQREGSFPVDAQDGMEDAFLGGGGDALPGMPMVTDSLEGAVAGTYPGLPLPADFQGACGDEDQPSFAPLQPYAPDLPTDLAPAPAAQATAGGYLRADDEEVHSVLESLMQSREEPDQQAAPGQDAQAAAMADTEQMQADMARLVHLLLSANNIA